MPQPEVDRLGPDPRGEGDARPHRDPPHHLVLALFLGFPLATSLLSLVTSDENGVPGRITWHYTVNTATCQCPFLR